MTREEAIKELEILKEDYWDDDGYGHETKQYDDTMFALDMAIKALEQEPTTKNDLAVDKTDMIDKSNFSQEQYKADLQSAYDCGYEQAKNDLRVDCIKKSDAINIIQDMHGLARADVISDAVNRIIIMSSVTPQPRKEHWIGHREHCENLGVIPSGLGAYEWCSECDCGIDVREWHRNHYNYCPNCGADMRGKEE